MKNQSPILIIDDDPEVSLSLSMLLEFYSENVHCLHNPREIVDFLNKHIVSVVLLDMNFKTGDTSGKEGLYWLEYILKRAENASVIMITAYGEVGSAVASLKLGAFDFISKPWENEKLLATVMAAAKLNNEKNKVATLSKKQEVINTQNNESGNLIWGKSSRMKEIRLLIDKVASTDANILITGENGTGKEMIARYIHNQSLRKSEVFMSVDLGAITDTLFASELFGHVKGAFTDAKESRMGRFQAADKGTLFLDEIANLGFAQQSKLLTSLQSKEIIPVGANTAIQIDTRLVCATNADLSKAVLNGDFREDLLYRINTIELNIPPLRHRLEDLQDLLHFFLEKYSRKYNKSLEVDPDVFDVLENYEWPGNIRELQHAVERAVILAEGDLLGKDNFELQTSTAKSEFKNYNLEFIEKWAIEKAIQKHKGNVSHAAEELGVSRGALYRRMDKYGL